ncbi:hypothetical protein G9F32_16520 [Acinetobacter sp. 194]|uniref:hypothetical protein n=1 Tax=Acinetobacter shaoyimingii TaxID=2715164 RepID=UPI00140E410B|nr:hypothetical protein [Acinetobacter shaoyimingii]NHB59597.1 hypothetical protein [Acinetobacter shaoyimingii]
MQEKNETIVLQGIELIDVLKEINYILISLHKIGAYYALNLPNSYDEYAKETTRFIDDNNITQRLANIRSLLSDKFDNSLGDDDMDDIERSMEELEYWSPPK